MKKTKVLLMIMILTFTLSLSKALFANAISVNSKQTYTASQSITISAAASLKDVLTEIQRWFEKQNKGIRIIFNFGGSGTLGKQIEAGAPVDVFISADAKSINKLNDKNLIDKKSIKDIATNQLVLVAYVNNSFRIRSINDLTKGDINCISIGTPGSVPAGDYARQSLIYYNIWDKVSKKIVYAKDVTQVLNYVKTGNAMAGFVYLTDAKKKGDAIIKQIIPSESHDPIVYQGAIISSTKYANASRKFMNFLNGVQARIIFQKYGFGAVKNNLK